MKDRTSNSIKPFWSWNDRLDKEELEKQIAQMKENGIEGFFIHARSGLRTEYMSNEWFRMIETCLNKADKLGMQAWVYDENGWPSGTADGLVPALGAEHQQKSLKYLIWNAEKELKDVNFETNNIVAIFKKKGNRFEMTDTIKTGVYVFYYVVNRYYIDVFNKETTKCFLKYTHEKYYDRYKERFGNSLKGFFTDEAQFQCFPWSFGFAEMFEKIYGYQLLPVLPLLFFNVDGYEAVRNDYHKMVSRLFIDTFLKQMYDWCTEHNCQLTGHVMGENSLHTQMHATNGVMACYEYFHEPGMDHLLRRIGSPVQPRQVGSVAKQLNRKTITESFALCGWDISLNELKWIAQWQYLNGVTSLCPHLQSYSLRGERKRDYPPSLFTQLPWFRYAYADFADYFTTLGKLLDSGKDITPVLMIHPIHSAYILHKPDDSGELLKYSNAFDTIAISLNNEHVLHHYGDETLIERYGSIKEKEEKVLFAVGCCEYQSVLLPDLLNLSVRTVSLLLEFAKKGGQIFAIGRLPEWEEGRKSLHLDALCQQVKVYGSVHEWKETYRTAAPIEIYNRKGHKTNSEIHLILKELDQEKKLLYLVNNVKERQSVLVEIAGNYEIGSRDILKETEKRLITRIEHGRTYVELEFAEYGSEILILYEIGKERSANLSEKNNPKQILLNKVFRIEDCDDNAITLDKCTYRIDDGEWQPEIAVINLQNKVLELQKSCSVEMKFTFVIAETIDYSNVKICMENPEKYQIWVNGQPYDFLDCGMFVDHAIRASKLGENLHVGVNAIQLKCQFTQSPELYFAKLTLGVHESVLNRLTYDTELESIYLTGRFGVQMLEDYTLGEQKCLHGGRTFRLGKPIGEVDISDITHQGYWFFAGKMTLSQKIMVFVEENQRYMVSFEHLNAPAVQIYVNDIFVKNLIFSPFEVDVTEFLKDGENKISVVMLSGNRNLLGPHHKPIGEVYAVGKNTFSDRYGWPDDRNLPVWTDDCY